MECQFRIFWRITIANCWNAVSAFQRKGRNHIWQELVFQWSRSLECECVLQPGKCKHLSLVNKTSISSESATAIPIHILVFPKILSCFSVTLTLDSVSQNYLWNWNLLVFIVVVDWSFDFWLFKTISSPRLLICNACQESWFSAILFLFVMAESLRLVCENIWFGFHLVFPLRVGCLAQLSVVERPLWVFDAAPLVGLPGALLMHGMREELWKSKSHATAMLRWGGGGAGRRGQLL